MVVPLLEKLSHIPAVDDGNAALAPQAEICREHRSTKRRAGRVSRGTRRRWRCWFHMTEPNVNRTKVNAMRRVHAVALLCLLATPAHALVCGADYNSCRQACFERYSPSNICAGKPDAQTLSCYYDAVIRSTDCAQQCLIDHCAHGDAGPERTPSNRE
jgi:hypothetical protein